VLSEDIQTLIAGVVENRIVHLGLVNNGR